MTERKIAFYFEEFKHRLDLADDLPGLIQLHVESFQRHGWTVIHATESDARRHPDYKIFDDPNTILGKSRNAWEYTRACYMRWLAYAALGYPFADLDVINYGFTPKDADEVQALNADGLPVFLSAADAAGLLEGSDYRKLIDTYLEFVDRPVVSGQLVEDINDMTIMRELRPTWYTLISYLDDRFVKDYTRDNWHTSKMVHYSYGLTPSPRAETILNARELFT